MQVELTEATHEDLPRLLEWMRQLRVVDPMSSEAVVSQAAPRNAIEHLISDASLGRAWIIRAGAAPVGYIVLTFGFSVEFGGRTAFIDELFIEEALRGKGVGGRVVELTIELARSIGIQNLLLEVTESNTPARRLYQSAGFVDRPYRLMTQWLGKEQT